MKQKQRGTQTLSEPQQGIDWTTEAAHDLICNCLSVHSETSDVVKWREELWREWTSVVLWHCCRRRHLWTFHRLLAGRHHDRRLDASSTSESSSAITTVRLRCIHGWSRTSDSDGRCDASTLRHRRIRSSASVHDQPTTAIITTLHSAYHTSHNALESEFRFLHIVTNIRKCMQLRNTYI